MKKLIVLIALLFPLSVAALESISVGVMSTDYNLNPPASTLFNSTTYGQSVTIGMHTPIPWLTVDIGLHNNGDTTKTVVPFTFELESKSVVTMVKGEWQVATISGMPLKLNTKAGLSITQFRARETLTSLSTVSTDIGYVYGGGILLDITPHWALELDVLKKQHKANLIPLTESNVHSLQPRLQIRYTF